jgi:lysosomal-associated membrane protein 1/2
MMLKTLVLFLSIAALCYAQNDSTVAPSTQPDVTTEITTLTTTQADQTTETTTSAPQTTEPPTTPKTTPVEPVTTPAPYDPSNPSVLNFTVPPGQPEKTCLALEFAVMMNIQYRAEKDGKQSNETLKVALPKDVNNYNGTCQTNLNTFVLQFWNQWTLDMAYSLVDKKYELSSVSLTYNVNKTWFPNAIDEGLRTVNISNLHEFQANKGSSYKCKSKTTLALGTDVSFDITNYHAEPFFDENKYKGFDIAVDCPADTEGTSKLVPIIVGSALAFLIVLVLIAYLIGRRRHRSGYQTV